MPRSYYYRGVLFLLLVILAGIQLRFAVEEQLVFSDNTDRLVDEHIRNPHVLTHFAKQQHLFEADLDSAARLLRQALICSPLYVPAWLSLAELFNDQGRKEQAEAIMTYADTLTRGIKRWRWEKTLTAYQLGLTQLLPSELRYIIAEIPGKSRNDALQLAFTLWPDPEELLGQAGPENLLHLFNHAVRSNRAEEALSFWQRLTETTTDTSDKEILAFIDMLLRTDTVAAAADIWRQRFNDRNSLYNADFSTRPMNRAFGWRITDHKGFEHRFEPLPAHPGAHALQLRFKGWENLNFHHILQIVPLKPGVTYRFSVQMRSAKMTTDQRPYWEISGYKCQAAAASSTMVAADQEWTEHTVEFGVPPQCSAMVVRLRRKESTFLDNKITGQVWLKEPSITTTGEPFLAIDELRND